MQEEKRHAARKRIDQLLYAELGPNNGSIVTNLSEEGCGFQAIAPIHDRELHFTLAIGRGQEIQGTGRITWLEKGKKAGGLRFVNLSASLREQIRTWLDDPRAVDLAAPVRSAGASIAETRAESEAKMRRKQLREEARRQWDAAQQLRENQQRQSDFGNSELGYLNRDFQPNPYHYSQQLEENEGGQSRPPRADGFWRGLAAILLGAALGLCLVAYHREVGRALIWLGMALSEGTEDSHLGSGPLGTEQTKRNIAATRDVPTDKPTRRISPRNEGSSAANIGGEGPARTTQVGLPTLSVQRQDLGQASDANDPYSLEDVQTLWARVENGDTQAEVALAGRYMKGDGIVKNCRQARVLLEAALKKGNADAQRKFNELLQMGCR